MSTPCALSPYVAVSASFSKATEHAIGRNFRLLDPSVHCFCVTTCLDLVSLLPGLALLLAVTRVPVTGTDETHIREESEREDRQTERGEWQRASIMHMLFPLAFEKMMMMEAAQRGQQTHTASIIIEQAGPGAMRSLVYQDDQFLSRDTVDLYRNVILAVSLAGDGPHGPVVTSRRE